MYSEEDKKKQNVMYSMRISTHRAFSNGDNKVHLIYLIAVPAVTQNTIGVAKLLSLIPCRINYAKSLGVI